MKTLSIAVLFALCFTAQVYGRPNNQGKEDEDNAYFADDEPQDYDAEEGGSEGNKGTSSKPPEILSRPKHLRVKAGTTVEFPCVLHNADDFATQWMKGKEELYVDDLVMTQEPNRIILDANNTLKIVNATVNDSSDKYICQILTTPLIKIVHSLRVVDEKDNEFIRVWPQKVIHVNESQNIKFGCEIAQPDRFKRIPDIKWSHKGRRLEGHNGEIVDGNYITINQVTRHNDGIYQCLADDGSPEPSIETIDVVVNYAPVIEVEQEIVHAGSGKTSNLSCKVHGHPRAKVIWKKNGKQISNKKDNKRMMIEDKAMRTLIIENTVKHDLDNYTCTAMNVMGEASKDIELTGRPTKPKFIGAVADDDKEIFTIKWHVESFSPITQYLLKYRRDVDTEWEEVHPKVNDEEKHVFTVEYSFENLPTGMYETELIAQNEFGWSPLSERRTFEKQMKSEMPENEKISPSNASTTQPFTVLAALLLVVASYVSISL